MAFPVLVRNGLWQTTPRICSITSVTVALPRSIICQVRVGEIRFPFPHFFLRVNTRRVFNLRGFFWGRIRIQILMSRESRSGHTVKCHNVSCPNLLAKERPNKMECTDGYNYCSISCYSATCGLFSGWCVLKVDGKRHNADGVAVEVCFNQFAFILL